MGLAILLHVAVAITIFPAATLAVLPNGQCSVEDMTCEFSDSNLIGLLTGVQSAEECKTECENNSTNCKIYSYYSQGATPFTETCLLFTDCGILDPCESCVTEDIECTIFCNAPVEGILGDNLVDIVAGITEADCEAACEGEERCKFFTYHYGNSSLYPETCFLLSELQEPISLCEDGICVSGSSKCEESLCSFLDNGVWQTNGVIVTDIGTTQVDLLRIGPCSVYPVIVVAVGGGGSNSGSRGSNGYNYAGAGSGYIEYVEGTLSEGYVQFEASVGSAGMVSEVTDLRTGNSIVRALPGEDGGSTKGGDGYSGGGGDHDSGADGGDGGSDGGDGYDSTQWPGGKGSGLDISTILLQSIELR